MLRGQHDDGRESAGTRRFREQISSVVTMLLRIDV